MQTSPPRLLAGRNPPAVRTGAYAYSVGTLDKLALGFVADDLQALDAPSQICQGSVTTHCWTSDSGQALAITTNTIGRAA